MPTVKVRNLSNKEVGDVTLSDAVFGAELNESLIHAAVRNYLANGRQGTSATKTRGNVSGSGRKLWKQKGTGRARIASIRSPLWKGGGNVHGPQPRDWSYDMPKKMRRGALRSALSERLREGNLVVIEEFGFNGAKTKDFLNAMSTLGFAEKRKQTKTLIVDSLDNANLVLSSRNVQKTKVVNSFGLNIYDIIYHEKVLISKSAVAELNELLDPQREGIKDHGSASATETTKSVKGKKEAVAGESPAAPPKAVKDAKPKVEPAVEETAQAPAEEVETADASTAVVNEISVTEEAPTAETSVESEAASEATLAEESAPVVNDSNEEATNNE